MSKTSFIQVPEEITEKYYNNLQSADRFIIPRMRFKKTILSRQFIKGLKQKTYLKQISEIWKEFTKEQKQAWKNVDSRKYPHGWRMFVTDQSLRIKLGLTGIVTPNIYHQDLVGKIQIQSPAQEIKLIQLHPNSYWISKKVKGSKNMYEPVKIEEYLSLPLKIGISYKSNLEVTGEGAFAKYFVRIRHLYQGRNLFTDVSIDMLANTDWTYKEAQNTFMLGQAISYDLYIHLYKVKGELLFDNLKAIHSGSNWARDQYCKKIERTYTRGFYQIPEHWSPVIISQGADYKSIYPI